MRYYFIIVSLLILTLAGCGESQNTNTNELQIPTDAQRTVYVIDGEEKDKNTTISINHEEEYDLHEEWESRQEQKEIEAKHKAGWDVLKSEREKEEAIIAEEKRLENYCNRLRSNSCLNMTTLTDSYGCREVEVSCNRHDSDNICFDYDVSIKREVIKSDEC
ncbi:MAG: hypothetical protein ACOCZQ_00405 [Nanoarchaeota archaeon]